MSNTIHKQPTMHMVCPKCNSQPCDIRNHISFKWSCILQCSNYSCNHKWITCTICTTMKNPIENNITKIKDHHNRKHKQSTNNDLHKNQLSKKNNELLEIKISDTTHNIIEKKSSLLISPFNQNYNENNKKRKIYSCIDETFDYYSIALEELWIKLKKQNVIYNNHSSSNDSKKIKIYHNSEKIINPSELVHSAIGATSFSSYELSEISVNTHIKFSRLCYDLTSTQRILLCDVLNGIKETLMIDKSKIVSTNYPTCDKEIRNMYLEGKKSIINNLTIPEIKKDK